LGTAATARGMAATARGMAAIKEDGEEKGMGSGSALPLSARG
jgi:hypothetical protein